MKNILVPIDFSEVSKNATDYAIGLAKLLGASITLFHVFHIPAVASESLVVMPNFSELESKSDELINKYKKELKDKHGNEICIDTIVKPGFLIEELKDIIEEKKFDLVIMGITGAGKLEELLMGSNSTMAINNIKASVIVVPPRAQFKPVKNIAFACDFEKETTSNTIEKVKKISTVFDAQLHILNVVDSDEKPNFDKASAVVKLEIIMNNVRHTLNFPESDDITFAINEFADRHAVDLLIMVPHKHNFLKSLFHKSNTKKMAFHTHIPLLAINE